MCVRFIYCLDMFISYFIYYSDMLFVYDLEKLGSQDYDKYYTPKHSSKILMVDNKEEVSMAENFKPSKNNRHIERRFHYVHHGQEEKNHKVVWIPKDDQLEDYLTKTQESKVSMTHVNRTLIELPEYL